LTWSVVLVESRGVSGGRPVPGAPCDDLLMKVLLAIPVYNEAACVERVLHRVLQHVGDVLVVDDGSTDGTERLLAGWPRVFQIRHSVNQGYGQSLMDAFAFARQKTYDWVITMDCDDQHEPAHLPEFLSAARADRADVISGSRYLANLPGNGPPPPQRRRINAYITALLNELLGLSLTDAFCGFKAYRVSALARLRLSEPGYAIPLQFWVQAVRYSLRIEELPVSLIYPDPNRRFAGPIDDPKVRLQYYLRVLTEALEVEADDAASPELREPVIPVKRPCR
jgi:glycosyltransferase involved in cell wall biosynthesis